MKDLKERKLTIIVIVTGFIFSLLTLSVVKYITNCSSHAEVNRIDIFLKDITILRSKRNMDNDINVDNKLDRFRYINVNTADDLFGYIAVGQGYEHCMELYFIHSNEVEFEVKIESKTSFVKMQGFYRVNNLTKIFECNILKRAFWTLFVRGNDSTIWSGDVNNDVISSGKIFYPVDQYYYLFQSFVQILNPKHLKIIGDKKGDIVRKWDFRVTRKFAQLRVKISITVVDIIVPEIKVSPQSLKVIEGEDGLNLMCSTQIYLPQNSLLTWKRNGDFLGSFLHSITNIIHRGIFGNVNWINDKFIYHQSGVSLNDIGIYECCILIEGYPLKCGNASITVLSPGKSPCVGKNSVLANPFQINQLQSRALLREGTFVIILWNFNISEWKISTRFPQCQRHLVNMELGIERWFGINSRNHNRNKRGIVEGALGGVGIIGSIANSMDINTLKSDLESAGLVGSKGFKIQRNLNQILEDMVIKTANVMGPSILHLQNITLNLMTSEEHSHIARLCLEIQTEYSTNFKIIAQAFQGGITPFGILQNLPREYAYARNHTDLWVNKWIGCSQDVCYSSSMIPIAGREQILVPITVLGLPISDTQLLFYKLQFKNSISIWGKTSITSAAGNILSHPIVIIFIIIMLCIIYQLFLMFRMKKLYKQIRNEIKKGDDMLQNKLKRRLGFGVANSMTGDNAFGIIGSKSECV